MTTHAKTLVAGAPETQLAFATEALAREAVANYRADQEVLIVHSPHSFNPSNGKGERWDYFIEVPDTMVRSWEKVCFEGLGANAVKKG